MFGCKKRYNIDESFRGFTNKMTIRLIPLCLKLKIITKTSALGYNKNFNLCFRFFYI